METNKIIGANLKELRKANGYTQEQVADFLGIQRSTYSNYELGDREAPIDILEKMCNLMGCEMDMLFNEDISVVKNMLVCSFRATDLRPSDMKAIAEFKSIVLNYLKMERILNR